VIYQPGQFQPPSGGSRPRGAGREVQSLLWLAAGAAWAIVALRAWNQHKQEARRRTFAVSDRLLHQVFPHGIRPG
jgi:hypothetical protein